MTNFKNVKQNVFELVKAFPSLKENYNSLLVHYWAIYDNATTIEAIVKATPAESITRALRKIVEIGLVDVPEKTKQARAEAQKSYKSEFSSMV